MVPAGSTIAPAATTAPIVTANMSLFEAPAATVDGISSAGVKIHATLPTTDGGSEDVAMGTQETSTSESEADPVRSSFQFSGSSTSTLFWPRWSWITCRPTVCLNSKMKPLRGTLFPLLLLHGCLISNAAAVVALGTKLYVARESFLSR